MIDRVYVQLTPIPADVMPPTPLEVIAYAASDQQDPVTAFIVGEYTEFNQWSPGPTVALTVIQGFKTRFVLLVSRFPEQGTAFNDAVRSFIAELSSSAVLGDTGTILEGQAFSSRARWVLSPSGVLRGTARLKPDARRATTACIAATAFVAMLLLLFGAALASAAR